MRRGVAGAPCPNCGSIRTQTLGTGYSDEGYRLRRRRCTDCDSPSFLTAEVHVPATWGELETSFRMKQRDYSRRRFGYAGRTNLARTRPLATLDVKVSVRRSRAARRTDPPARPRLPSPLDGRQEGRATAEP